MTEGVTPEHSIVEALGIAWGVHSLYPDPERQPAFQRAVAALQLASTEPVALEIGVHGFARQGEPITSEREGAERLGRRCFIHNLELLRITQPANESDVVRLFNTLAKDEETVRSAGGVEAALIRDGVSAFSVVQRSLLRATGDPVEPIEREGPVAAVLAMATDPASLAAQLVEEAGEDPEAVATLFESRYNEVLGRVAADDITGREEVVRAFVEAFFYLPDDAQLATFRLFLGSQEREPDRVFLDQFAGHELAKMAPKLDTAGLSLLLDYARLATDQADKRPDELMALLQSPEALESARQVVAATMQEKVGEGPRATTEGARPFGVIESQIPDPRHFFYDALEVFRGLLHVEERDQRFGRLLRIWTGKVGAAVRRREFRRAELWLRAVTDTPTYPEARSREIGAAMQQLASSEIMELVVAAATASKDNTPAVRLLESLGPRAVGVLIDLLAEEEGAARRRTLIDVLARVATRDPAPVVQRLDDPRWYVVRNLVLVLGKTGNSAAAGPIADLLNHEDHRVRVEALRATTALSKDLPVDAITAGLSDPHETVRHAAIGILAGREEEPARAALAATLSGGRVDVGDRLRIIRALADNPGETGRRALERVAAARFVFTSAGRQVREAAREALRKSTP